MALIRYLVFVGMLVTVVVMGASCAPVATSSVSSEEFIEVSDEIIIEPEPLPEPEIIPESEPELIEEEVYYEEYWDCEPVYYEPAYIPSDGLNQFSGVNEHDGRLETYYSSNVLYHHKTNEWTLDEEGFYRTEEGYYVVAASDMEQGTTFEGSKGTCIVLDSGCAEGVTDYYVAW